MFTKAEQLEKHTKKKEKKEKEKEKEKDIFIPPFEGR